jgi:hypothetical protein
MIEITLGKNLSISSPIIGLTKTFDFDENSTTLFNIYPPHDLPCRKSHSFPDN